MQEQGQKRREERREPKARRRGDMGKLAAKRVTMRKKKVENIKPPGLQGGKKLFQFVQSKSQKKTPE